MRASAAQRAGPTYISQRRDRLAATGRWPGAGRPSRTRRSPIREGGAREGVPARDPTRSKRPAPGSARPGPGWGSELPATERRLDLLAHGASLVPRAGAKVARARADPTLAIPVVEPELVQAPGGHALGRHLLRLGRGRPGRGGTCVGATWRLPSPSRSFRHPRGGFIGGPGARTPRRPREPPGPCVPLPRRGRIPNRGGSGASPETVRGPRDPVEPTSPPGRRSPGGCSPRRRSPRAAGPAGR